MAKGKKPSEPEIIEGEAVEGTGDRFDIITRPADAGPGTDLGEHRPTDNPAIAYIANLAVGSRRTMAGALNSIAHYQHGYREGMEREGARYPWHTLTRAGIGTIRTEMGRRMTLPPSQSGRGTPPHDRHLAPRTANKWIAALKGALRESWRLGFMPSDQYHRAADVKGFKVHTLPKGRMVRASEQARIFQACAIDGTASGARDAAMIGVMIACGLRRGEVVKLDAKNYDPETGELKILGAKGGKDRTAYVANGARDALDDWLKVRGGEAGEAMFCRINKGGSMQWTETNKHGVSRQVDHDRMTSGAVAYAINRRIADAEGEYFTPHDCRRTFGSQLFDAGIDTSIVQGLMGHASPVTTLAYDRRPEARKREAVQSLTIPYVPPR